MKNVKTKAYALLAVVPLLMAGFGGNVFATPQSVEYTITEVEDALASLQPHVTIDEKKIGKIDVKKARANGLDEKTIKIGKEYLQYQNAMIKEIHENPDKKMKISDEGKKKFKKFNDKVRKEGFKDRTIKIRFLDYVLPLAYADHKCNVDGPHPQPDSKYVGNYSTAQAAIDALPNTYEKVSEYAAAFEHDYHDWVIAYNCFDGVFRYQTSIVDQHNDGDYQHRENHSPGEPNPEVLEYLWPVWWWGFYVEEWHDP